MVVNRVTWSPNGHLIGVAFTKHLIHLHAYQHPNETRQVVEIEAHSGGVNDIAFSQPNKQLCVVTCGDDKLIRVWDMHGQKIYSFEGHEAPVYSICPHHVGAIQFIFSTSVDGKIKAWLYDDLGSRVDYHAPENWCTAMLYSADGTRLFSCGTSKQGDTYLVKWNQSEGSIERSYSGFRKKPSGVVQGVVQFDTAQNHILAAGEDNQIKFWDVDNINMLTCVEADGGLPSLPRLRFNKEGNLLAVTTIDSGFKVLANTDGLRSLLAFGNRPFEVFRVATMPETPDQANKVHSIFPEESANNDSCVMAACGGKVSKVLDDDDLLREIIVRISFSTTLVRAALVCKRWYQHVSEPAFLCRFRKRHPSLLLGFYLEDREHHNVASIRFFPMLPQPPELASVIRRVASYSLDSYHGAPANFLCSRSGRVLISLYNQNQVNRNKFTVGVHSPLCTERGLVVVPPFPHVQIQDGYYLRLNDLLSVEEADGLSYLHVSFVSNMQRTKSTVHVHILRHGDGMWCVYLTLDTDNLLDLRQEPKPVLANNKIYIASAQSNIVVLDLTASSISTVQLPRGVEYGSRNTMLAQAGDASGVYLIHAKKLQLHIWLHKGDNWLLVNTICLHDMLANLRIPGCEVDDEPTAALRIKHVGDYAEFVFLEMGRCALHLDVKCMQLRKVYDMTEELHLGDIHPLMMIWPPIFPALKDNPARNAM